MLSIHLVAAFENLLPSCWLMNI